MTISVDSLTGNIRFDQEMTNVYSEITYDRTKGPKVLSRIPQDHPRVSFESQNALRNNFDYYLAVDTNSKTIQGQFISAVGIVRIVPQNIPRTKKLETFWKIEAPFALEFTAAKGKPENLGWLASLEQLYLRKFITGQGKITLIVDSDLGNLGDYNKRAKPIFADALLPLNVTLIYASSDTGRDSLVNQALSVADSIATQILSALENGTVPMNTKIVDSPWYQGMRLIHVDRLP